LQTKTESNLNKQIINYIKEGFKTKYEIIYYLKSYGYNLEDRQLRKIIRDLVLNGIPIISESRGKDKGYKLELDTHKLYNNAERLKHRAIKIMERAAKLEKIISDIQDGKLF